MARPPRGRKPEGNVPDGEGEASELPLDLSRADAERPRLPRAEPRQPLRAKSKMGADRLDDPPTASLDAPLRPALRGTAPANAKPARERLRNPFDNFPMPTPESEPLSKPITKSSAPEPSEFLTSKYYTPRSDLTSANRMDSAADQTGSWASNVRPGRSLLDRPSDQTEEPEHLRFLPPRVREHLRAEPRARSVSESQDSVAAPAAPAPQDKIAAKRPAVPRTRTPEKRDEAPTKTRTKRNISDPPFTSHQIDRPDEVREPPTEKERNSLPKADDTVSAFDTSFPSIDTPVELPDPAFMLRPARNEEPAFYRSDIAERVRSEDRIRHEERVQVDEAVNGRTRAVHDGDEIFGGRDQDQVTSTGIPSWLSRTESTAPLNPVSSDWDQDQALHALTSRMRDQSHDMRNGINRPRGEILNKLRSALDLVGNKVRDKATTIAKGRNRADDILETTLRIDPAADAVAQNPQQGVPFPDTLRATRSGFVGYEDATSTLDQSIANSAEAIPEPQRRKFWQRRPQAPIYVAPDLHRASRRQRQSRLYEDIVAWIVVPPFVIGAIYGGLELAKFLSNSPLGKMLSGQ